MRTTQAGPSTNAPVQQTGNTDPAIIKSQEEEIERLKNQIFENADIATVYKHNALIQQMTIKSQEKEIESLEEEWLKFKNAESERDLASLSARVQRIARQALAPDEDVPPIICATNEHNRALHQALSEQTEKTVAECWKKLDNSKQMQCDIFK
jgi:predicted RNase H-like nuclease (RuvC/YqgF family)